MVARSLSNPKFIEGGDFALQFPRKLKVNALELNLLSKMAEITGEYSNQGDHRAGTQIEDLSGDWLKEKITASDVRASGSSFPFPPVQRFNA